MILLLIVGFCAQNMESIPSPPVMTLDPNDENIILEIPKDVDPTEESAEPISKKEKVKTWQQHCGRRGWRACP